MPFSNTASFGKPSTTHLLVCFLFALSVSNANGADNIDQNLDQNINQNIDTFNALFPQLSAYLKVDNSRKPNQIPLSLKSQFADPMLFSQYFFLNTLSKPDWRYIYQENLNHFDHNYSVSDRCTALAISSPTTLAQAATQIEQIGKSSQQELLSSLPHKDWRWIRKNAHRIVSLIKSKTSNDSLSRRQKNTLKKFESKLGAASQSAIKCSLNTWRQLTTSNWIRGLHSILENHPHAQDKIIMRVETPLGAIIFGGKADKQIYEKNILFIASLGGNDFYGLESTLNFDGSPQLIIDFGGNDRYQSSQHGGIASGAGKISILIDFTGDDHYLTNTLSLGAGLLGYGLLVDLEGRDQYESSLMSQGFGHYGYGQLIDLEGDDIYGIAGLGQGVGLNSGLGFLYDASGDDRYTANGFAPSNYGTPGIFEAWSQGVGVGFRPFAAGGIGILLDLAGSDLYTAGSFSQGGGYFYGQGALIDKNSGNDTYLGSRYHLAWAAHRGLGLFFDEGGNDIYNSRYLAGASAAWDRSISTFIDGGGDDQYSLGEFSYGSTAHHSLAIFLETGGKDHYQQALESESFKGQPNLSIAIYSTARETRENYRPITEGCKADENGVYTLNLDFDLFPIEDLFEQSIYSIIKHKCPNAIKQD